MEKIEEEVIKDDGNKGKNKARIFCFESPKSFFLLSHLLHILQDTKLS